MLARRAIAANEVDAALVILADHRVIRCAEGFMRVIEIEIHRLVIVIGDDEPAAKPLIPAADHRSVSKS